MESSGSVHSGCRSRIAAFNHTIMVNGMFVIDCQQKVNDTAVN